MYASSSEWVTSLRVLSTTSLSTHRRGVLRRDERRAGSFAAIAASSFALKPSAEREQGEQSDGGLGGDGGSEDRRARDMIGDLFRVEQCRGRSKNRRMDGRRFAVMARRSGPRAVLWVAAGDRSTFQPPQRLCGKQRGRRPRFIRFNGSRAPRRESNPRPSSGVVRKALCHLKLWEAGSAGVGFAPFGLPAGAAASGRSSSEATAECGASSGLEKHVCGDLQGPLVLLLDAEAIAPKNFGHRKSGLRDEDEGCFRSVSFRDGTRHESK